MTTQTEALKLALEALEALVFNKPFNRRFGETIAAIKEALAQEKSLQALHDENDRLGLYKDAYAQPEHEYDWKDLYEKEKRRSAMWIAKYEEVAGPAPKAYPVAQPEQELCEYCKRGLKTMCLCGIATKVIHQFRSLYCADWYDGIPDHHDGHGPYEVRTLYTTPPQPEQEPVGMYRNKCADGSRCLHGCHTNEPCYTTPPQRTAAVGEDTRRAWVGLTDDEIHNMTILMGFNPEWVTEVEMVKSIVRNLEAKLKEKNT